MRLSPLTLAFFGSLAALAAPLACSGGERPAAGENGGGGGNNVYDSGGGGSSDSGDAGEQGEPADIAHLSTICGARACGIMGTQKSGFQELADVSFIVKDSAGKPVSGVQVKFELESPPQGTAFLGDSASAGGSSVTIATDVAGKATARVQSGITLGVFTVVASVNTTLQARSPAIGVRGVTPSNRGFTLQCANRNLAAWTSASPDEALLLTTTCTVTLVDRFNNPVGKQTSVNLKVEAGTIASSVLSTEFNPSGSNAEEGKASVVFSTAGTFPPVDVSPTPNEPFETQVIKIMGQDVEKTLNPRDGLVTILAYVVGEEAFDDNNANGMWDPGERFYDQGEPFVDTNDNNQYDESEFYIDLAPENEKYDPPNGVWDRQTTIWTNAFIMYSGAMTRALITPASVNVAVGATEKVNAGFSDERFNPPPPGGASSFVFSRSPAVGRGSMTVAYPPILDGYGGITLGRALYDAENTVQSCTPNSPRCVWLTRISYKSPYIRGAEVTLTGAPAAGTGESATLVYDTTVQGVPARHTSSAFFQ